MDWPGWPDDTSPTAPVRRPEGLGAAFPGEPHLLRLYDFHDSGNGYKVRLLLGQLRIPCEVVEVDILSGQSRTAEFLARNPNGRIPLLELEDGRHLAESNAILFYLAEGTPFLPAERWAKAQVMQWMFFEQYNHEPNIATSRFWLRHTEFDSHRRRRYAEKLKDGAAALQVMENHLAGHRFFVADRYTIADIALYAYTHVADEGGFDLSPFAAVRRWLERVRTQPGHIPMATGGANGRDQGGHEAKAPLAAGSSS